MLKRITFCLSLIAASVLAGPPQGEMREHFVIASRDHTPLYYATTIASSSETLGSETYLFESTTTGQRVVIEVSRNYRSHLTTVDYAVNDAKPVRVTLQLPGKGTTRAEARNDYRQAELRDEDVPVTLEAHGKILKTGEKEWKAAAAGVHEKAKSIVGSEFAAAMKPVGSFLGLPPFGGACSTYQFVADGAQCGFGVHVLLATVRPDCDFDAKFGKPCDSMQLARAKQQPKDHRVGPY